jgi:hypothetical protein
LAHDKTIVKDEAWLAAPVNEKLTSWSVVVELPNFFRLTVAPGMGSPEKLITLPFRITRGLSVDAGSDVASAVGSTVGSGVVS